MTEQTAPKIEFPCENYPIKVIGWNKDDLRAYVIETVGRFDPTFDPKKVTEQGSRNGKFLSVRFSITATGEAQLAELHKELMASGRVQMVI